MSRRFEDFLLSLWSHRGLLSTLLLPPAWLYQSLSQRAMAAQARTAWRAPIPVIVIGNILVGGTGKTPLASALCKELQAHGWHPGLVSRGYGIHIGAIPHLSDDGTRANHLGDEPALLHAATGVPVAVHPRRARAARALLAAHPEVDVLIADDGLQHRALARDLELIVQDARGVGNGRLLPAGPLREPPARLATADWLITHLGPGETLPAIPLVPADRQVTMRLIPTDARHLASGERLHWPQWQARYGSQPCGAAAGIGQPERFFAMLRAQGVTLARTLELPDHGPLQASGLRQFAQAPILITHKDAVKCPARPDPRLWAVQAEAHFNPPDWITRLQATLPARMPSAGTHDAPGSGTTGLIHGTGDRH